MDDEIFIPPIVQKMVDDLTRDTGTSPTIRRYVNGLLMEHENEHVRMTIYYKLRGGKWQYHRSTLILDGVNQKMLSHGYDDYLKVFGLGRRQKLTDGAEKVERPDFPLVDEGSAPAAVRTALAHHRDEARRQGVRDDGSLLLRKDGDCYVIQFEMKVLTLYLHYGLRHGEWGVVWEGGFILAISEDDYDVSKKLIEVGGDITRLLQLMGHEVPEINIPQQINRSSETKRLNSVEVRNSSVMRI